MKSKRPKKKSKLSYLSDKIGRNGQSRQEKKTDVKQPQPTMETEEKIERFSGREKKKKKRQGHKTKSNKLHGGRTEKKKSNFWILFVRGTCVTSENKRAPLNRCPHSRLPSLTQPRRVLYSESLRQSQEIYHNTNRYGGIQLDSQRDFV